MRVVGKGTRGTLSAAASLEPSPTNATTCDHVHAQAALKKTSVPDAQTQRSERGEKGVILRTNPRSMMRSTRCCFCIGLKRAATCRKSRNVSKTRFNFGHECALSGG